MNVVGQVEYKGDIKETIKLSVDSLGGFGKFVEKGDVVLLKPNFNTADPPPASTDMDFLKAAIELVYDAGAKTVILGESSTMTINSRKVFEEKLNAKGVFNLEKMDPPPRIFVFDDRKWEKKSIPKGKYLKTVTIPRVLNRIDKLILLPCLKTHKYAKFTGALKLSVGFMKPTERMALHMRNLQEKVADLNTIINPNLIIMDARKCFINGGPSSGDIEEPNLILASESRVLIDIEGIKIIQSYDNNSLKGIKPTELAQIKRSIELGLDQ